MPGQYHLAEFSSLYAMRTKRNVREADGTVVFSLDSILTGQLLTFDYAAQVKKPRIPYAQTGYRL